MKTISYVIQGLTLLTKSLVLPFIISRHSHFPVKFDTISRATLHFTIQTSEILSEDLGTQSALAATRSHSLTWRDYSVLLFRLRQRMGGEVWW